MDDGVDSDNKIQRIINRVSGTYIQIVQQRARVLVVSFMSGGLFGVVCFVAGYMSHG